MAQTVLWMTLNEGRFSLEMLPLLPVLSLWWFSEKTVKYQEILPLYQNYFIDFPRSFMLSIWMILLDTDENRPCPLWGWSFHWCEIISAEIKRLCLHMSPNDCPKCSSHPPKHAIEKQAILVRCSHLHNLLAKPGLRLLTENCGSQKAEHPPYHFNFPKHAERQKTRTLHIQSERRKSPFTYTIQLIPRHIYSLDCGVWQKYIYSNWEGVKVHLWNVRIYLEWKAHDSPAL